MSEMPSVSHAARDIEKWTNRFFTLSSFAFLFLAVCTVGIYFQASEFLKKEPGIIAGLMSLRILQVTLGLLVGLTTLYLGVLVSWAGVTAPMTLETGLKDVQSKLATSSPGIVLVLCGTGIMVLALLQKIDVQDGERHAYGQGPPTGAAPSRE